MQINASSVSFTAEHSYRREETRVSISGERRLSNRPPLPERPRQSQGADASVPPATPPTATPQEESRQEDADADTLLLKALVEILSGRKITLYRPPSDAPPTETSQGQPAQARPDAAAQAANPSAEPPEQFQSFRYNHYSLQEYEYSSVDIHGEFVTRDSDGGQRQLTIDLSLTMERYFEVSQTSLSIQQGKLTDPLVLNFNGQPVQLSTDTTLFDINSDGSADRIHTLTPGNAYLALDRDGDGAISDGSELFGPLSGNGFGELAAFDQDGNGFIDAGDAVFSELGLFRPGDTDYSSLSDSGVTAIYTGSVASPFQLTDSENNLLGAVKSSGFFLTDDGNPGVIQQIDLRV